MKNFLSIRAVLLGLFLLDLAACQVAPYQGVARDVKRKPGENGIVSMPLEYRDEDRVKAETKMRANCGSLPFHIQDEGEVVVGQEVQTSGSETNRENSQHSVGKLFGMNVVSGDAGGKDQSSTSVTKSVKEWQISYNCEKKTTKK